MLRYLSRRAFPLLALWGVCSAVPEADACSLLYSSGQAVATTGTTPEILRTVFVPNTFVMDAGNYLEIRYSAKHATGNAHPQQHFVVIEDPVANTTEVSRTSTTGDGMPYLGEIRFMNKSTGNQSSTFQLQRGGDVVGISLASHTLDLNAAGALIVKFGAHTPNAAGDLSLEQFTVSVCDF
jgi:hypothetical protein